MARIALLGLAVITALALIPATFAHADDTVSALGADPSITVAKHRHCVSSAVTLSPNYLGGGGVKSSYLYINGERAVKRTSSGSIKISVRRLAHGVNSFELIGEFADGRAASVIGSLRRCGGS
ncbi:MAG: hypothetical protein QM648_06800 [Solirubrobacterales bacterium]